MISLNLHIVNVVVKTDLSVNGKNLMKLLKNMGRGE